MRNPTGPSDPSPSFAYERLSRDVADGIRRGTLREGDRLPSVRTMSTRRGVSVSTVLQAYRRLEALRLVEARPRSGYYVRVHSRAPSPRPSLPPDRPAPVANPDLIVEIVRAVADPEAVPLGAAVPDPSLLPVSALRRSMVASLRTHASEATMHLGPDGVAPLRHEIARREWNAGRPVHHDELLVTCGVSEALDLALRATTRPGDVVAVESPTFFGILQTIEALGRRALEIPTSPEDGIDLDALEAAVDAHPVRATVLVPNVHNPLGFRMTDARKERLVSLLSSREIAIVEDDTFGELAFDGTPSRSLRAWDGDDRVLRCGSFGKTLAPGYRLGWIVPGPRYLDAVRRGKLAGTMGTSAPAQFAVARYLEGGAYDRHLRRLRRTLGENVRRLAAEVDARFPDGTRIGRPTGGFVLWVELPPGSDALRLFHQARREGISIAPGPIFSPSGGFRRCLRLSAGHPWSEGTDRALERLATWAADDLADERTGGAGLG